MLNNTKLACIALISFTLAIYTSTSTANEAQPSLSFFAIHHQELTTNNDMDFDGINLEVSGKLKEHWVLSASYAQVEADGGPSRGGIDWDITYGRLGYLAYNNRQLAVLIGPQVQYISYEIPYTSSARSDTSFGAYAEARYRVSSLIEIQGSINYIDASRTDNNQFLQYELGARTFLAERFALEGRLQLGDWQGFMLGGSVHF